MSLNRKLTVEQRHIIRVVTIGGALEWYEIYSFVYLAPVLSKLFFNQNSGQMSLVNVFLLFGIGFIGRPFGAIVFGRIGDLVGRKKAFIYSIFIMTIPTFLMGCLPTYESIGILAPMIFYLLRFFQSIPVAGETPGAICFLYENARSSNVRFMSSWSNFGNQIGTILALVETILLDLFLSEELMLKIGWRILFWSGGLLGLFAIYLRTTLMETPVFKNLESHHKVDKESISELLRNHKSKIVFGTAFGSINAVLFYVYAVFFPDFAAKAFQINDLSVSVGMLILMIISALLIPIFGKLSDVYNSRNIFLFNSYFSVFLVPFLYYSVTSKNNILLLLVAVLYLIPLSAITAVYPYWIAHIFKPKVRYTSVGVAFNLADAIVGGFSPAIALLLYNFTNDIGSFSWYVLMVCLISVFAILRLKEPAVKKII